METVAYVCFKTPESSGILKLCESISLSGLSISHFGFRDPPKKRQLSSSDMASEILSQPETNKWSFLKDGSKNIDISLELNFDPRWLHSTLLISGKSQDSIVSVATSLSEKVDTFLSFYGILGGGKEQIWKPIYASKDCPETIRNRVKFA